MLAKPLETARTGQPLPTNDEILDQQIAAQEEIQQSSEVVDYQDGSSSGISAGKVVGAIGFGLLGLVGLGMLIEGAK